MRLGIVAVGSELMTPFFQDTDSLFLTQKLNELGLEVDFKFVVGDEPESLKLILSDAVEKADLLFIIGGLGPTEDDRTREVLADVLGKKLVFQPEILQTIEKRFKSRGLVMPASNRRQAFILEGATILPNRNGTAPGEWVEVEGKKIIILPGPPRELQPMFEEFVWPRLQSLRRSFLCRKVLKTAGMTESQIEDQIKDLYPRESGLKVTLLAYPGQIEIHLTSLAENETLSRQKLDQLAKAFQSRLGVNIFSSEGEELEAVVGQLLRAAGQTVAVAESCSGGLICHRLTAVPGSSDYFLEGVVVYSNQSKVKNLHIPAKIIEQHGAVSQEVAQLMAENIRLKSGADLGLATTGIAGPGGGTPNKPVGLVFVALATSSETTVSRNLFLGSREQVKFQASQKALDMLRRYLLEKQREGK
jgi:nicotinamide-nucleotide amidase